MTPALSRVSLFADLDDDELAVVLARGQRFDLQAGDILCQQGDDARGMYVIEGGRVQVTARVLGEADVELATLGTGTALGELALVDEGTRSATVRAIEPTSGWFIPKSHFSLLRALLHPAAHKVLRRIGANLAERLRANYVEIGEIEAALCTPSASISGCTVPMDGCAVGHVPAAERMIKLQAFRGLTADEFSDLLRGSRVSAPPRGTLLFQGGDAADSCFFVARGAVQLFVAQSGSIERVATLGPGKVLGQLEFFDHGRRAVCALVREDSLLIELPFVELERMREAKMALGAKLVDSLLTCLVEASRAATQHVVRLSAEGRMRRRCVKARSPTGPGRDL